MTWTLISAILAAAALILVEWLQDRKARKQALEARNEALEQKAAEERAREQEADEKAAKEVIASGDAKRAIGFLRESWERPDAASVPAAGMASPTDASDVAVSGRASERRSNA